MDKRGQGIVGYLFLWFSLQVLNSIKRNEIFMESCPEKMCMLIAVVAAGANLEFSV